MKSISSSKAEEAGPAHKVLLGAEPVPQVPSISPVGSSFHPCFTHGATKVLRDYACPVKNISKARDQIQIFSNTGAHFSNSRDFSSSILLKT